MPIANRSKRSLQEVIYLSPIVELVKSLLQLRALDGGMIILLMKFTIFSCVVWFLHRDHGIGFLSWAFPSLPSICSRDLK